MRFDKPTCPECGEEAEAILDMVPGLARIGAHDDGTFEYSGETDIWWDDQVPWQHMGTGEVQLRCQADHSWLTTKSE